MKKGLAFLCAASLLLTLSACGGKAPAGQESDRSSAETASPSDAALLPETNSAGADDPWEENTMQNIEIVVGNKAFTAVLNDSDAAKALKNQLPMTLNMSELNGNEKYFYLSDSLPADAEMPSGIHEGDLMLYGNNCLVLFYESFSTSYSYTPLGHIEDTRGLADALGSGSVQVIFRNK